jgi:hypothetical protein
MELSDIHHTSALYLDLECTFWEEPPPPGMKREIIEIGVAEMDLQSLMGKNSAELQAYGGRLLQRYGDTCPGSY